MSSPQWSRSSHSKRSTYLFVVARIFFVSLVPTSRALQIFSPEVSTDGGAHGAGSLDTTSEGFELELGKAVDARWPQEVTQSVQFARVASRLNMTDAFGSSQAVFMVPLYLVALNFCVLCCCTCACMFNCFVPKSEIDKKLVAKVERASIDAENDPEVRWLNDAIAAFWPHLDAYIQDLMVTVVQPALKHELNFALKEMVSFGACSLGDKVPCLGPIVVRERGKDTVILEVGLSMDLGLNLSISHVGVKRVLLSGVVSVIFYPMKSKPPFFAGLQVYFANPPDIDLEFSGLAELAETPYIKQAIRGAIVRVVNKLFVSPARFAVDLDPEDTYDITDMRFPDPIGILRLTATGLQTPTKDYAAVDVHAVVKIGSGSSIMNIARNDAVDMAIYDSSQRCNFDVFAKSGWVKRTETLIGQARDLSLDNFANKGQLEESQVKLDERDGEFGNGKGGILNVSTRWFTMSKISSLAGACFVDKVGGPAQLLLSVKVQELSGVLRSSLSNLMSRAPFVARVSIGESVECVSGLSRPKQAPMWARLYKRELIVKLADKGMSVAAISDCVELDTNLVEHILRYSKEFDEEKKARMHKEFCASINKVRSVEEPQWNEVIRLLLPWDPDAKICIEVKAQGGFRVGKKLEFPLSAIVAPPDGELKGPFSLEDENQNSIVASVKSTGLELLGSLRVTWYEAS